MSRFTRRVSIAIAICMAIPLCALMLLMVKELSIVAKEKQHSQLLHASQLQASHLRSRLSSVEAIVQNLTHEDTGLQATQLRHKIATSRAIKSAVVVDKNTALKIGTTALQPTAAQLVALEAGQSILLSATLAEHARQLFLVRAASVDNKAHLVYFEIAPEWLWQRQQNSANNIATVTIDAQGRVMHSDISVDRNTIQLFARALRQPFETVSTGRGYLEWDIQNNHWVGSLSRISLDHERVTALPWATVAIAPKGPSWAGLPIWSALMLATALAILCLAVTVRILAKTYVPILKQIRKGLFAIQARDFRRINTDSTVDEPRALALAFNRCAAGLEAQFHALETLGEIDKLLLGSTELEHVLDVILSRVRSVTNCHGVSITLCDADAPAHARTYLAAVEGAGLPVSRVVLDADMLNTLIKEPGGLTIARCEEQRHSFLKPLRESGSQFFWIWPVISGDHVDAILSIGYREAPVSDPQIALCGAQFAERLGVALSKTVRDERLYRQAHYDVLTGLPNRLLFRDRLAHELTGNTNGLTRGALLYIDLDHFKRVNDCFGHNTGDQLLTIVAQRARSAVKDGDTVARLSGDEFAVILRQGVDPGTARAIAERIIESVQLPVSIGGRDHHVGASIGITLFPDDGNSLEELTRNADMAMYRAKALGRGRVVFFEANMASQVASPSESGLHRALKRREFSLFYQPRFAIAGGALVGVEALLRWQTPQDGVLFAAEFIPAAEESGVIVDLGGWVLEAACAQMALWRDRGLTLPRLALNVSAHQLRHPDFLRQLQGALDKHGLPASLLELELMEAVFTDDTTEHTLERLAALGVGVVLEDFGAAHASLNHLHRYPVNTVKIDRRFLEDIPRSQASVTLVETILSMAHSLNKRVVAEGVETVEQLEFLRERGCDIAQGYYLARPLIDTAMTELLQTSDRHRTTAVVRAAG
jgi:diguanylate cyclase (GGDEF)-like protein